MNEDILYRAADIIQDARDFVRRYHEFQSDAPTLAAELDGLLHVLRGYDDPEQDTFIPGLPKLADDLARVIHVSNMDSSDAVVYFWRNGR